MKNKISLLRSFQLDVDAVNPKIQGLKKYDLTPNQTKWIKGVNACMEEKSSICGHDSFQAIPLERVNRIKNVDFDLHFNKPNRGAVCYYGSIFVKASLTKSDFFCEYIYAALQWFAPVAVSVDEDDNVKIIQSGLQVHVLEENDNHYDYAGANKGIIEVMAADLREMAYLGDFMSQEEKAILIESCAPKQEHAYNLFKELIPAYEVGNQKDSIKNKFIKAYLSGDGKIVDDLFGKYHSKHVRIMGDTEKAIINSGVKLGVYTEPVYA